MVVTAATAAYVPFSETTGKPIKECEGKSNKFQTYNVPHESDCTKFYKCLGPNGFEVDCPTLKGIKLFFNPELQVCDWEGGSNCQNSNGTTDTSNTPTSATPVPEPDCSVNPDRKKPHADRHKYYECVNGKPEERTCREGTYFNPHIAECDLEQPH
ncbi:uncharacterized protein LOC143264703 [Megachile rotundata]|uniref:uncharacterized protein LOC143264703 n=1 Tax=Megachile rotundata TaxID=143995 RepID=UPI003FD2B901